MGWADTCYIKLRVLHDCMISAGMLLSMQISMLETNPRCSDVDQASI